MARSLNGWTILAKPRVTRPSPNGRSQGFANDDTADILAAVMWWWHTEIEWVTQWGGHRTPDFNGSLGNSASRSNHLSATATDTNWSKHPFHKGSNKRPGFSFSASENRTMDSFDSRLSGILRSGREFLDEMHWEIAPGTTAKRAARVAAELRETFQPPRTEAAVKVWQRLVGVKADGLAGPNTIRATRTMQKGLGVPQTGLWDVRTNTAHAQALLNYVTGADLTVDGKSGPNTTSAVKAYQKSRGLTTDGKPGPNTLKKLEQDMADIQKDLSEIKRYLIDAENKQAAIASVVLDIQRTVNAAPQELFDARVPFQEGTSLHEVFGADFRLGALIGYGALLGHIEAGENKDEIIAAVRSEVATLKGGKQ